MMKKLKKKPAAYHKRTKRGKPLPSPPKGFIPHPTIRYIDEHDKKRIKFRPSKKLTRLYFDYIDAIIKDLADCIGGHKITKGLLTDIDIHENKDGSVDGQVMISGIPRNTSIRNVMISLSECMPTKYSQFIWVSFGFRWPKAGDDDDERYEHYRGLNQTFAYPQRGNRIQNQHLPAVRMILEKIARAGWKKPVQIIARFNWNPDNMQPKKLKKRKRKGHGRKKHNR